MITGLPDKITGLLIAGILLSGASALPLMAQSEPSPSPIVAPAGGDTVISAIPTQADLDAIEASITLGQERIDALRAEIAEMEGDQVQQNAALIAAAQRVKLAEIEVNDVERRLHDLIMKEFEIHSRLDGSNAEMANVLAALQRITLNPPPPMIVDPGNALGSARSAMLISAIVPQLRARADTVTADLKALTAIKTQMLNEEAALKANYVVLEEEQLRIATLIIARKQGLAMQNDALTTAEAEAMQLAERAASLRAFIDNLSARANAARLPRAGSVAPLLPSEQVHAALANTARTEPAIPFAAARGYLTMPSDGVNIIDYGANDGFGGISRGLSIVTHADAQVVAPADGWVLYKGPYLNYGQIIILNSGGGYTTLLAGLETITVDMGQFVQMGMPLGTMGSRTIGRSLTTRAGTAQPTLYIELRRNNEPIDPTDWWATPTQSG